MVALATLLPCGDVDLVGLDRDGKGDPRSVQRSAEAPDAPVKSTSPPAGVSVLLRHADRNLNVGERLPVTVGYVAPDPLSEWGKAPADRAPVAEFWVGDGSPVNNTNNPGSTNWYTPQQFETLAEMRWFIEASHEYYAAYLI